MPSPIASPVRLSPRRRVQLTGCVVALLVLAALAGPLAYRVDPDALDTFLARRRKADPEAFGDLSLAVVKLLGRGEYALDVPGAPSPQPMSPSRRRPMRPTRRTGIPTQRMPPADGRRIAGERSGKRCRRSKRPLA